jgi:NADPH2:quinone reductase
MKAIISTAPGDIDSVLYEELQAPVIGSDQVRIAVRAAGVNFADLLLIQGKYQDKPKYPFAPGLEVSGVVLEGRGDTAKPLIGRRVMAAITHGGFAEEVVTDTCNVIEIPDHMSYETAATIPIAYGTSYLALTERARLHQGEVVLVHGASGGVGLTAVEISHALGATVIATASSHEKLMIAKSYGADVLINYAQEEISKSVLNVVEGVDVVFDPVGGTAFEESMHCILPGGRILIIGFASGSVPKIAANHLLVKDVSALGFSFGKVRVRSPEVMREALNKIIELWRSDQIHPFVSNVFPLSEAKSALKIIRDRQAKGKIALRVSVD